MKLPILALLVASLAPAQAPLFQILDEPVPPASWLVDAIGDLDGDGDADLLSGVLALNDGHGRFTQAGSGPSPNVYHQHAVIADLNGDGLNDIVSVTGIIARIEINTGGLVFAPVTGLPALMPALVAGTTSWASDVAVGDFDTDGDLDVAILTVDAGNNYIPGRLNVWLNNGLAAFTAAPPAVFPGAPILPYRIAFSDLDLDGDLDALVGQRINPLGIGLTIRVATNAGGIFTVATTPIWTAPHDGQFEVGDFNGDLRPDVIASWSNGSSASLQILVGTPTGFLAPVTTAMPSLPDVVLGIDTNGDGADEILTKHGIPGRIELRSFAGGTISAPLQAWPDLSFAPGVRGADRIADLDGDGDKDVVALAESAAALLMNTGTGALTRATRRVFGFSMPWGPRTADLDGDGDADLVGYGPNQSPPTLATGINDGNGWFTPGPSTAIVPGAYDNTPYPFDRDGDGDADLWLARNSSAGTSAGPVDLVYDNVGGGNFVQIATVAMAAGTSAFQAFDVDGDGDQDVLVGRRGVQPLAMVPTDPMRLVLNLGPAGFATPVAIGGSHATYDLDVGDFDGNGTLDVFQTNANAFTIGGPDYCFVYLGSGTGTFTGVYQFGVSGFNTAAGDLNGDGMADVVVDGQVLFAAGGGAFVAGTLSVPVTHPVVLADVDQDGDLDLVETPATVHFNNGSGVFNVVTPSPSFALSVNPQSPASSVADLDRDGDLDIVAYGPLIVPNALRQIAHGSLPRPGRPVSIEMFGTSTGLWTLWASNGTTAFPYPPWGNVLIDPASAQLVAGGIYPLAPPMTAGHATFSATLPSVSALVGATVYCQAIDFGSLRFTNRLTLTVLGY